MKLLILSALVAAAAAGGSVLSFEDDKGKCTLAKDGGSLVMKDCTLDVSMKGGAVGDVARDVQDMKAALTDAKDFDQAKCFLNYGQKSPKCNGLPDGWNTVKTGAGRFQGAAHGGYSGSNRWDDMNFNKPQETYAIRVQHKPGHSRRHGWYRVTEIVAYDEAGNRIQPAGARTDNWHGAWRHATWAGELYDQRLGWGDNHAVHFHNHATIWFSKKVTVSKLRMYQFQHGYDQSPGAWDWQVYGGDKPYSG